MAGPSSDYHRGEMEIAEQTATYQLVMGMTKWGSLGLSAFLLFVILWFCTGAGFMGGAISGLVLLVLGIVFLREKPGAAH
jgi:multisubunit Na+/H+ antiporter MnhG subunit